MEKILWETLTGVCGFYLLRILLRRFNKKLEEHRAHETEANKLLLELMETTFELLRESMFLRTHTHISKCGRCIRVRVVNTDTRFDIEPRMTQYPVMNVYRVLRLEKRTRVRGTPNTYSEEYLPLLVLDFETRIRELSAHHAPR